MTAWSLGILKIKHNEFAVCLDSLGWNGKLESFEPQHVANLLWGLAKSGSRPSADFMFCITDTLSGRLHMYAPQEIFNICWALATMGFRSQSVASETLTELKIRGSEFGGLELSGISWALSRITKGPSDHNLRFTICSIIQKDLRKHVGELQPSQVAMAIKGLAHLDPGSVDPMLVTNLVDSFCGPYPRSKSIDDDMCTDILHNSLSVSSVNTLLEGLSLLPMPLPAALCQSLESRPARYLDKAKFWEVCDLCYYLSQNDMVNLASAILLDRIEGTVAEERVTPRGAIMLLEAMRRCSTYPPMTLKRATMKLSMLSPNYSIGDQWLRVLADLLSQEEVANHLSFHHKEWDDRISRLN